MNGDVATWGSIVVALGCAVSIIGFWTRFSDRITKAETKAAAAADALAEAKRKAEEAMAKADLAAAKLYQVEIWARDEFVRKASFETVVARLERGFGELKSEITGRLDRMTDRIEHINSSSAH
jgi:hypothetical protein